jgi:hypothetical protein
VSWWSRRQAEAARAYESALGALLAAQRLLPGPRAAAPAAAAGAAGPPPEGPRRNGQAAGVPAEVHHRLEPYLRAGAEAGGNGHAGPAAVPAGATE